MDSYFLAETLKYLYLLFDESNWVLKHFGSFVFNTEGHLFPLQYKTGKVTGPLVRREDLGTRQSLYTCKATYYIIIIIIVSGDEAEPLHLQGYLFSLPSP